MPTPSPVRCAPRSVRPTVARLKKQLEYNAEHGITPQSVQRAVVDVMEARAETEGPGQGAPGGQNPSRNTCA